MSGLRGRLAPVFLFVCAVVLGMSATACSGGDEGRAKAPPFDGAQVLRQASAAMANLKSVGFTVTTEDKPPVAVRGGDIKLLRAGDAEGTLTIVQSGQSVEMKIVAVGQSVYIKGVTGGWRQVPKALASSLYDPSAVLDPNRGISKLLSSVTGVKAEGREKADGKDSYRVGVTLPKAAIEGLIPGIRSDVRGQVWVSSSDHKLIKVRGEIPPLAEGGEKGSVVITFTEFDHPYTIKAPV
ncbi:LppX_LprAFG lipoprotein [Actinomadura sp. SCN-SB]|uniref:LppX_LprAFG lipoprotein n=1 Tax=Actinomadura sp. SCN-SB TaxID=3373092 RepID=UPI00375354CF